MEVMTVMMHRNNMSRMMTCQRMTSHPGSGSRGGWNMYGSINQAVMHVHAHMTSTTARSSSMKNTCRLHHRHHSTCSTSSHVPSINVMMIPSSSIPLNAHRLLHATSFRPSHLSVSTSITVRHHHHHHDRAHYLHLSRHRYHPHTTLTSTLHSTSLPASSQSSSLQSSSISHFHSSSSSASPSPLTVTPSPLLSHLLRSSHRLHYRYDTEPDGSMYDFGRDVLNENEHGEDEQSQYGSCYGGSGMGMSSERKSLELMQQELRRAANGLKMGVEEEDERIRQLISSAIPMLTHQRAVNTLLRWMSVPLLDLAKDEEMRYKQQQEDEMKQAMQRSGMGADQYGMNDLVSDGPSSPYPSTISTAIQPPYIAHPHSSFQLACTIIHRIIPLMKVKKLAPRHILHFAQLLKLCTHTANINPRMMARWPDEHRMEGKERKREGERLTESENVSERREAEADADADADESGRMVGNGGVQHTMDADGKESMHKMEQQSPRAQRLVSPVQLASILYHHVMQYGPKPSVNFMTQAMQFFCTHGMDRNAINIITAKPDDATSPSSAPSTSPPPSTYSLLSPDEVHSTATSIYADMTRQGVKPDHFMYSIPIFSLSDAIDRFMENDILRGTAGDTRRALVSSSTDLSRHLHRLIALYDLWVKECGAASVIPNVPPRILSLLKYQPFHHLSAAERIFDGYLQHRQQTLQLPPPPGVGVYDLDVRAFNAMLGFWVEHGLVERCWSLFLLMHAQAHIPTPNLGSSPSSSSSSSSSSSPSSSFTDLASTPMMDGNGNSHQSIHGKVVKTTNVQTVTVIPVTCPLPDNVCYMEMMSALLMDEDAIMTHDSSIDTDHELVTTKTPTLHGLLSSSTSLSLPPLPPFTQRPHSAFLLWQELLMRADEGMAAMRLYEQSMKQYRKEVWKLKQQFMKQQQEAKTRTRGSSHRSTPLSSSALVLPPEPIRPTGVTNLRESNFNVAINALTRADHFNAAVALFDGMRRYGLTPNLGHQLALISAANQSGRYEWAIKAMQHHVPNIVHPSAILTASTIAPSAHEYRRATPFIPFYIQALCGLGRVQDAAGYILECRKEGYSLSLRTLVPFILKVDQILIERAKEKKRKKDQKWRKKKQDKQQEKSQSGNMENDRNITTAATASSAADDQIMSGQAAIDLRAFSHHIAYDILKQYLTPAQSTSASSLTSSSSSLHTASLSSTVSSTSDSTASSSHPTDTDSPSSQATTLTHPHHQSCMSMNDHECVQRLRHLLSTIQRCCTQIDAVRTYALTHADAWNDGAERSRASDDHNDNDRNAGSNSRASEHRHDISVSVSNSNSGSISNSLSGVDSRRSSRRSIESMIAQRLWRSGLVLRTSSLMMAEKVERLMNEEYELHPQIIIEHHHDDGRRPSTVEGNVSDPSTSAPASTSTSTSAPPSPSPSPSFSLSITHTPSHYVIHVNPSMLHEWVRRMSEEVELEREIERARQRAGDEEEAMKNDVSSDSRNVMTDRTQNHDSHSSPATSSTVTASSASSSLSPMMNGVDDAVSKKVADDHESSIGMGEHSSIGIESEVDESKSGGKKDDAAGVVTDDSFASRSRATFSSFIQSIRRTRD